MDERVQIAKSYTETKPLKLKGRKLVLFGFGSVGRPFINRLLAWSTIRPGDIYIYDKQDLSTIIPPGIHFKQREIVRKNYRRSLRMLKKGDLVVDLSLYIDSIKIMKYCIEKGLHFINTSIEAWDLYTEREERTLISSFKDVAKFQDRCEKKCPTIILNHGANPGIVSHFVRMALDSLLPGKKSHAEKAKELKIRTIHIAEIDTQTEFEKDKSKWRNTWSINGFYEEGTAPPELGMGSHESIPKDAEKVRLKKTKALILPGIGWKTMVRSSLPGRPYEGYLVQHAEALSINNYLSTDRYSPSVYYVYRPCPASIESIEHFGVKRDPRPAEQKMLYHSNSEGEDRLGVLLLGPGISRYYGSYCSSTESRLIFEQYQYAGPTSSQVVAGILSALWLILRKPRLGIMEPDDIPPKYTQEMLKFVKPLLGEIVDEEIAWRPKEFDLRHLLVRRK